MAGRDEDFQNLIKKAATADQRWQETNRRQAEIITRLAGGVPYETVKAQTVDAIVELRMRIVELEADLAAARDAATRSLSVDTRRDHVTGQEVAEALIPTPRSFGLGKKRRS